MLDLSSVAPKKEKQRKEVPESSGTSRHPLQRSVINWNAYQCSIHPVKGLRAAENLLIVFQLLLRQAYKLLTVCWSSTEEEGSCVTAGV